MRRHSPEGEGSSTQKRKETSIRCRSFKAPDLQIYTKQNESKRCYESGRNVPLRVFVIAHYTLLLSLCQQVDFFCRNSSWCLYQKTWARKDLALLRNGHHFALWSSGGPLAGRVGVHLDLDAFDV